LGWTFKNVNDELYIKMQLKGKLQQKVMRELITE